MSEQCSACKGALEAVGLVMLHVERYHNPAGTLDVDVIESALYCANRQLSWARRLVAQDALAYSILANTSEIDSKDCTGADVDAFNLEVRKAYEIMKAAREKQS
jgi:hypothetical protein